MALMAIWALWGSIREGGLVAVSVLAAAAIVGLVIVLLFAESNYERGQMIRLA